MPRRVVKCEKRAPRDFSPTFYHLCHHSKKSDGALRSLPIHPIPGTYTTKSGTYKTGLQGRKPPAGASPWGLLEPSRRKLPSRRNSRLFFSTFEPAPKISNYVASRGTCVQIVARAKGTFIARCKCFLSRSLVWEATDGRILTSRAQDATNNSERKRR